MTFFNARRCFNEAWGARAIDAGASGDASRVAAGHGTAIGTKTFAYDDHGRQVEYSANGVLNRRHLYNAFGARVARWHVLNPSNDMVFVYDEAGHIIGEYRTDGTRIREYVWMDDTPTAVLMTAGGSNHQYILTDHLNTPRAVIDPTSNAIIWRWDITTTAFGEHAADGDPDGDGNGYTLNLRYPGQFFDSITGVHQNYYRDYDPGTGRYVQSDPIGQLGGMATFQYASGSPLTSIDPNGLEAVLAPTYVGPIAGPAPIPAWVSIAGRILGGTLSAAWPTTMGSHPCEQLGVDFSACLDRVLEDKRRRDALASDEAAPLVCPRTGFDKECELQAEQDEEVCRAKTTAGTGARARCWESVQERFGACQAGNPIPPLVTW